MIRRPPRSTLSSSSAASDVYKRQSQRKGNVVDNNKHVLKWNIFLFEPVTHCISAEIHICGRFEKEYIMSFVSEFTNCSITPVCKRNIGRHGHGVQYCKSYIMSGVLIPFTYISQANYKIFHQA